MLQLPKQFVVDLLDYLARPECTGCVLGSSQDEGHQNGTVDEGPIFGPEHTKRALKALALVIKHNPGT